MSEGLKLKNSNQTIIKIDKNIMNDIFKILKMKKYHKNNKKNLIKFKNLLMEASHEKISCQTIVETENINNDMFWKNYKTQNLQSKQLKNKW